MAGMPTTAACPSFAHVAERSARCVERLIAAGAISLGKTNLDQFATGLSGARSPYGVCPSVADDAMFRAGRVRARRSPWRPAMLLSRLEPTPAAPADTGRFQRHRRRQADRRPGLVARAGPELPDARLSVDLLQFRRRGQIVAGAHRGLRRRRSIQPQGTGCIACFSRPIPLRTHLRSQLNSFGMPECDALYEQACERLAGLGGQAIEIDFAPFAEAGEMLFWGLDC